MSQAVRYDFRKNTQHGPASSRASESHYPDNSEMVTGDHDGRAPLKYRADIDSLRAIAVLSVVGYHAFPERIKGGFIGVDIFFVISGFLISTIIIGNLEHGSFDFFQFYVRRIKRIFPALLVVLVASLVFGWLAFFPDEFKKLGKHIAAGAGFVANFALSSEIGYFDNSAWTKPLLHLWSLGIEEQFYILWPLLLWLSWKKRFNLLQIMASVAILSFATNIWMIRSDAASVFYSPLARFWELSVGSCLAYLSLLRPDILKTIKVGGDDLSSFAGIALILIGLATITPQTSYPGWWALFPTVGAAAVIAAGPQAWANRVVLSNRLVVWIGLISYPLYLWHWPLLSVERLIVDDGPGPSRASRLGAIVASIALAALTYRFIEKPIRFGNYGRLKAAALLLSMIFVGVLGFECYIENGFAQRIIIEPAQASSLFLEYPQLPLRNKNCDTVYPELKIFWSCLLSEQRAADVVIVGDSHAQQYYKSLAKNLQNRSVLSVSYPSCLPFSGKTLSSTNECRNVIRLTVEFLRQQSSIKTIYLTGYFSYLAAGGFRDGNIEGLRVARPLKDDEAQSFQVVGEDVLSALETTHKDIVVIRDIPDMIFRPRDCIAVQGGVFAFLRRLNSHSVGASHCGIEAGSYEDRIAPYDAVLSRLLKKFPRIRIFDPRPLLCDSKYCRVFSGNVPLYWNSDHLSMAGSDLIIKSLIESDPPSE